MRRSWPASLALTSAIAAAWLVAADARPRYGGRLTVEVESPIVSLDPTTWLGDPAELAAKARLTPLVFDTLVKIDDGGRVCPGIAASWERDKAGARWLFRLVPNVTLHDGSRLTTQQVATRLSQAHPEWSLRVSRDTVEIRPAAPMSDLPWELASAELAIAVPGADGALLGSGPFRPEPPEPGRPIVLRAHDRHHAGRPFLDEVVIETNRPLGDQFVDFELGRADIVSLEPQASRKLAGARGGLVATRPLELVAVVRDPGANPAAMKPVLEALSLAVNREAICEVLFQRHADPAGSLLPAWLSGRVPAPVPSRDLAAAAAAAASLPSSSRAVPLQFDARDPMAQAVAERVAADAREAGLAVRLDAWRRGLRPASDLHLVRVPIEPTSPDRALAAIVAALRLDASVGSALPVAPLARGTVPATPPGVATLPPDAEGVVPLAHRQLLYAVSSRLRSTAGGVVTASGRFTIADTWVSRENR